MSVITDLSCLEKIMPNNNAVDKKIILKKDIKNFDAFLALGCVIKGETPHFDLICKSTFESIQYLSITYNKPIGNGIITAFTMKQARKRCGKEKLSKPNKE